MNEHPDYYCHLYVDADTTDEELAREIADILKTTADGVFIETDGADLAVRENDEYDELNRHDTLDGFLYYRHHVDIDPKAYLGEANAANLVSTILEQLWSRNYAATAACGYEDKLPHNGKFIPESAANIIHSSL